MKLFYYILLSISLLLGACTSNNTSNKQSESTSEQTKYDPMQDIGFGPITEVNLTDEINQDLVSRGKTIYDAKCTACHKPTEKFIGPAPKGIFERRNPVWIMNMILNPDKMIIENKLAKKLLMEFNGAPMANQNLTEDEARAILEYFRTL
ncbi:MAG: cytochrome c [Chlorobi bacterium]|nr:cytochrome c [Chlorobiota bacterium]